MLRFTLQSRLDDILRQQLQDGGAKADDFLLPPGEPALVGSDSISWIVFSNLATMTIGGIAAVILELAEPKIRAGVWDYTSFRTDPLRRMQRTAAAAMITVYAAESRATKMIEGVRRMHDKVRGTTSDGQPYHANDPELLRWVHATAAFGFLEAYHQFVRSVAQADRDLFFSEGVKVAKLYGADEPPTNEAAWEATVESMLPRLEPSPILSEFLEIMHRLPLFPRPLRSLNGTLVGAAIDILPPSVRERLKLPKGSGLPGGRTLLKLAAQKMETIELESSARRQARIRLGLTDG